MEEEEPNMPSSGNSAVGEIGQCLRGQDLEVSRPEMARLPTSSFELSGGSGLQFGSGNTMTVKINKIYYGNDTVAGHQSENNTSSQWISWKKDTVVSVRVVVAIVAVLVAVYPNGYPNSTPNIQSPSLPSIALGFTGREDEVNSILDAIVSGTDGETRDHPAPSIVNIVGAPGCGKSALAIAVGHALLRHGIYVYYVGINNLHKVKVAVTAILTTVIDGTDSSDPHCLYRWAGRLKARTVVILDNCDSFLDDSDEATRNEFLDFLSKLGGFSSKKLSLLTTSQYHFKILDPPMKTVRLGQLREIASESLLQFMYRQLTKTNAKEFAQLAGYNPLALKVTGALLQDNVPIAELKEELKQNTIQTLSPEENRSEDQVRACISLSFSRLSEQLQKALVTLAGIPGTFDESDANAILNVTNSSLHESLTRKLKKRCLVELEEKSNRYSLHSLIAAYAKEKEHSYKKPWETQRVIIRHLFRKLKNLAIQYDSEPLVVLKLYDLNKQNFQYLFDAITSSSNETGDHKNLTTITSRSISRLAVTSDKLIHARMLPSQQVLWYKTALRRSKTSLDGAQSERRAENIERVCQVLCLLVETHIKMGNVTAVAREIERQKPVIRTCNETCRFRILNAICLHQSLVEESMETLLHCHQRMWEPLAFQEKPMTPRGIFQLGDYYLEAGYTAVASKCYEMAFLGTVSDEIGSSPYEGSTVLEEIVWKHRTSLQTNYIAIFARMKDRTRSILESITDKSKVPPPPHKAARTLVFHGHQLYKQSMYERALTVFFQAVEVQTVMFGQYHVDTLFSFQAIGQVYFAAGNYTSAVEYFNRSLSISNHIHGPDSRHSATLLGRIGDALHSLDRANAIDYWKQALEIKTRMRINDWKTTRLMQKIAEWHAIKVKPHLLYDVDYGTTAHNTESIYIPEKDSPAVSAGGSANTPNVLPFITMCPRQLKDGLSEVVLGMTDYDFYTTVIYISCYSLSLSVYSVLLSSLTRYCLE